MNLLRTLGTARGLGWTLIILVAAAALGADLLAPRDPTALGAAGEALRAPGPDAWLGTDALGRDMLSRLLHGARVSLLAGLASVVGAVAIGTGVGLAAALGPRRLDRALMALTDLMLAFPRIFLVLLLVTASRPSLWLVVGVIAATGWMGVARLVRAEALSLRERDFVLAARGLGLGAATIARRHVLPHLAPLVLTAAVLRLGNAILMEAFLSYLGLGAQDPIVSWGAMIEHGRPHLVDAWWLSTLPGAGIALVVVGVNLLADDLRVRLDPRRLDPRRHGREGRA